MANEIYGPDGKKINKSVLLKSYGVGESALSSLGDEFENPDTLISRKGIEIYDTMMNEVQVENSINAIRYSVIPNNYQIIPATKDKQDVEIADFVAWVFENMDGSLKRFLWDCMSAIYRGYAILEKNFKVCEGGKYNGMWALSSIKPQWPGDYELIVDEYNNLIEIKNVADQETTVPIYKFIVYSHNPEDGNIYGRSVLRKVYKHYWSKDFLLKWWNIYLETYGFPTRIAKYPAGSYSQSASGDGASQNQLQSILKDIMSNTAITIPNDIEIDFEQVASGGALGFLKAIEYHDKQIVTGIQGQTLTSTTGDGKGSYALGDIHAATKETYVGMIRSDIEDTIMFEQVIKQLVDLNYQGVESYPKFRSSPRGKGIEDMTASDVMTLFAGGIITPSDVNDYREKLGLPRVDISGKQWRTNVEGKPLSPWLSPPEIGPDGKTPLVQQEPQNQPQEAQITGESKSRDTQHSFSLARKKNAYEERVNFEKLDRDMTGAAEAIMEELAGPLQKMKDNMLAYLPRRVFVGDKVDTKQLQSLKLIGLRDFKNIYKDGLKAIITDQAEVAYKEINVGGTLAAKTFSQTEDVDRFVKIKMEDRRIPEEEISQIRKWREAGEWAKIRAWRNRMALELSGNIDAQAFWITDVIKTDILRDVKNAIMSGVTNGADVKTMMKGVGDVFEKYIARGDVANKAIASAPRLETIVRTNVTRAFNLARREAFKEGAASGNFPALMYSAILDERTTAFCSSLDGKIYAADDPVWNSITPHNHLNCRSIIVAVFVDDVPEKFSNKPNLNNLASEFGGLGERTV